MSDALTDAVIDVMQRQHGLHYWSKLDGRRLSPEEQRRAWLNREVSVRDLIAILSSPEVRAAITSGSPR